jgi:drug/metabolite transporter (DMT)-like permease
MSSIVTSSGAVSKDSAAQKGVTPGRVDRPFRGILLLMSSTIFLATSDAMAKYLSKSLPPIEIAWLRFTAFIIIMLPIALANRGALKSVSPGLQTMRGVAMLLSSLFFITGLQFLPIAEAAATAFIAPVFVTALSMVFLGEKVGKRRWIATLLGLCGVMIIVRPGTAAFHPAAILPILSALAWAFTLVLTRQISGRDSVVTTMSFTALVGFLVLSAFVPLYWVTPTWHQVAIGACIGIAATAGHWIVILAFRYADASVLAPFSYSQLLWVTALGFLLFGEVPDIWTVCGAAVIIASGLYTAHRERMRRNAALTADAYPSA